MAKSVWSQSVQHKEGVHVSTEICLGTDIISPWIWTIVYPIVNELNKSDCQSVSSL